MSERDQRTAVFTYQKMHHRYDDNLHHKHKKAPLKYRKHYRTHPAKPADENSNDQKNYVSTGLIRKFKLKKIRKRLDNGRYH